MKSKISKLLLLVFFSLGFYFARAQPPAEMPGAPKGSYTGYFKPFIAGAAGMPQGSDLASKAVVGLYYPYNQFTQIATGTAFFVPTYPKDKNSQKKTLCMCTAAHVLDAYEDDPTRPMQTLDLVFKYQGIPDPNDLQTNKPVSGVRNNVHARLLAAVNDIALIEVYPDEFTVPDYAMIAISPEPVIITLPDIQLYILSHANEMPLKVTDSLKLHSFRPVGAPLGPTGFDLYGTGAHNNSAGPASSGAPVIIRGLLRGPVVSGVQVALGNTQLYTINNLHPGDQGRRTLRYNYETIAAVQMAAIMPHIRKHCWPKDKKDSLDVEDNKRYEVSAEVSNAVMRAEFNKNMAITSQAGLSTGADQSFKATNPGSTLVKATTLTVSCALTGTTEHEKIYGLAPTIELPKGFSYTAAGNYEMQMDAIVLEPMSAGSAAKASRTEIVSTNNDYPSPLDEAVKFSVRPNPSSTGIFELLVPASEKSNGYSLKITAADGRLVNQKKIASSGSSLSIDLSKEAKGIYILNIYDNSKIVYTTQLVY